MAKFVPINVILHFLSSAAKSVNATTPGVWRQDGVRWVKFYIVVFHKFMSVGRKGLLLSLGNSCNTHHVPTKWCLLSEMTWWIIVRNVGSRLGWYKCLGCAPGMIKKANNIAHWLRHIRSPSNHPLVYSWCWVFAQTDIFMKQCTFHILWSLIS